MVVAIGLDRLVGSASMRTVLDGPPDDALVLLAVPSISRRHRASPAKGLPPPRTMRSSWPSVGSIGRRGPIRRGRARPRSRRAPGSRAFRSARRRRRCGTRPPEAGQLPERRPDIGPEPHPALPLVLGRGHDPGVEAHAAGDEEDARAGRRGRAGAGPSAPRRGRWSAADRGGSPRSPGRTPPMPSEPARTLPVPPGTTASGVGRPRARPRLPDRPIAAHGHDERRVRRGPRGLRGRLERARLDAGVDAGPGADGRGRRLRRSPRAGSGLEPCCPRVDDDRAARSGRVGGRRSSIDASGPGARRHVPAIPARLRLADRPPKVRWDRQLKSPHARLPESSPASTTSRGPPALPSIRPVLFRARRGLRIHRRRSPRRRAGRKELHCEPAPWAHERSSPTALAVAVLFSIAPARRSPPTSRRRSPSRPRPRSTPIPDATRRPRTTEPAGRRRQRRGPPVVNEAEDHRGPADHPHREAPAR